MTKETIFDKIIRKEIPAKVIYEDDLCLCFLDINPTAKFHALLVPKNKDNMDRLYNAEQKNEKVLGHMMVTVAQIAKQNNLGEGYRIVINDGKNGCQTIDHLHLHIIGG